ncbi:MAG: hypothetical protein IT458_08320 [Planctomycetes bacterium]|nr:hypothetical protein [Planctomycetota bacterium]
MLTLTRCAALAALSTPLLAQNLAEGYAGTLSDLPDATSAPLVLDAGGHRLAYFTGTRLVLREGAQTRDLLVFSGAVFAAFTIRVAADTLLFGDSSSGDLWLVPLAPQGTPRKLANVPFPYDADLFSGRHVLVSAKTGGFSAPDNDVLAIDLVTGAKDLIARLPGASGPLAVTGDRSLVYATAANSFPPPPGSSEVLAFGAGQVAGAFGPGVLTRNDAHVVQAGLDSAGDLAFDGDGDLLWIDWRNRKVLELSDALGPNPRVHALATYLGAAPDAATLQFLPAAPSAPQSFEPFQPAGGGTLVVFESAFQGTSRLRRVEAARPTLTVQPSHQVPVGPFALTLAGGPAGGTGILALGVGLTGGTEVPLPLPGFEQRLFWDPGLLSPLATLVVPLSAGGTLTLGAHNPGLPFALQVRAQVGVVDASARVLGSSNPLAFTLR